MTCDGVRRFTWLIVGGTLLVALFVAMGCALETPRNLPLPRDGETETPTATPSDTPTATSTITPTHTPTATSTPTATRPHRPIRQPPHRPMQAVTTVSTSTRIRSSAGMAAIANARCGERKRNWYLGRIATGLCRKNADVDLFVCNMTGVPMTCTLSVNGWRRAGAPTVYGGWLDVTIRVIPGVHRLITLAGHYAGKPDSVGCSDVRQGYYNRLFLFHRHIHGRKDQSLWCHPA